jgi:hypothetical protein
VRKFVDQYRHAYGVEPICKVMQVAPSGYWRYAAQQRNPALWTSPTPAIALGQLTVSRKMTQAAFLLAAKSQPPRVLPPTPPAAFCWVYFRFTFENFRDTCSLSRLPASIPGPCTTPVILALYSIVTLTAKQLMRQDSLMTRHAAWYAKDSPTFSDTIALVRRPLRMVKIPRALFDRLTETVCYAG